MSSKCDFCGGEGTVDGQTKFGPWAFMCEECAAVYGKGIIKPIRTFEQRMEELEALSGEAAEVRDMISDVLPDDPDALVAEMEDLGFM